MMFPGGKGVSIEEIRVADRSPLAGRTIAQLEYEHPRMPVVASKREPEEIAIAPEAQTQFLPGDLLTAIGADESLKRLAEMAI